VVHAPPVQAKRAAGVLERLREVLAATEAEVEDPVDRDVNVALGNGAPGGDGSDVVPDRQLVFWLLAEAAAEAGTEHVERR